MSEISIIRARMDKNVELINEIDKYRKGKIYAIKSDLTDKVYYGSTTKTIKERFECHRVHFEAYKEGRHNYMTSYEILQHNDAHIELYENYPCNSKRDLEIREGQIIRQNMNDAVNIRIEGRTQKEYQEVNRDSILEYKKVHYKNNRTIYSKRTIEYRNKNGDKLRELAKQQHTCECGGRYTQSHKSHHLKTKQHVTYFQK